LFGRIPSISHLKRKKMKTKITLRALLCSLLLLVFGNAIAQTNIWIPKANFGGSPRDGAVSFSINGKGYICAGGTSANNQGYNDVWEYDPMNDTWTQKANFPGYRLFAIGFSIGNYGYMGLGTETNYGLVGDFWRYDPIADTWSPIATFLGSVRSNAVNFVLNGKGYICLGNWPIIPDVWEYDPLIDAWTQKSNFPGGLRMGACAFSIGTKAYIATGQQSSSLLNDLWQYNPSTDTWIQKANFGGAIRAKAIGFSLDGFGYVGTGNGMFSTDYSDMWKYDTLLDQWSQIANFPGARGSSVAFVIGNRAFAGTGRYGMGGEYQDLWEYIPDSAITTGVQDHHLSSSLSIFPNPAVDKVTIQSSEPCVLTLRDLFGRPLGEYRSTGTFIIERGSLPAGVYLLTVTEGEKSETVRIVFIE
jgi:N-acetylneuraminic acid mutarotase